MPKALKYILIIGLITSCFIFLIVVITIENDEGISRQLPPITQENTSSYIDEKSSILIIDLKTNSFKYNNQEISPKKIEEMIMESLINLEGNVIFQLLISSNTQTAIVENFKGILDSAIKFAKKEAKIAHPSITPEDLNTMYSAKIIYNTSK